MPLQGLMEAIGNRITDRLNPQPTISDERYKMQQQMMLQAMKHEAAMQQAAFDPYAAQREQLAGIYDQQGNALAAAQIRAGANPNTPLQDYTLGAGAMRFDPMGNVVARGAPQQSTAPAAVREFLFRQRLSPEQQVEYDRQRKITRDVQNTYDITSAQERAKAYEARVAGFPEEDAATLDQMANINELYRSMDRASEFAEQNPDALGLVSEGVQLIPGSDADILRANIDQIEASLVAEYAKLFGANPTEGERTTLINMVSNLRQAAASGPRAFNRELDRIYKKVERDREQMQRRAAQRRDWWRTTPQGRDAEMAPLPSPYTPRWVQGGQQDDGWGTPRRVR